MMVMVVRTQQISHIIIIPNNSCSYIFAQKSLPEGVPDHALLLAVRGAGHHPVGPGGLETCPSDQVNDTQELFILHLG